MIDPETEEGRRVAPTWTLGKGLRRHGFECPCHVKASNRCERFQEGPTDRHRDLTAAWCSAADRRSRLGQSVPAQLSRWGRKTDPHEAPRSRHDVASLARFADHYPAFAFSPAASMPATAQASSLSLVSPLTPTAPSKLLPSWIKTPPGTGTSRPCASAFTALMK